MTEVLFSPDELGCVAPSPPTLSGWTDQDMCFSPPVLVVLVLLVSVFAGKKGVDLGWSSAHDPRARAVGRAFAGR